MTEVINGAQIIARDNADRVSVSTTDVAHDELPKGRFPRENISTSDLETFESNYVKDNVTTPRDSHGKADTTVYANEIFDNGELIFRSHAGQMPRSAMNATPDDIVTIPGLTDLTVQNALDLGLVTHSDNGYRLAEQERVVQQQEVQEDLSPSAINEQINLHMDSVKDHIGNNAFNDYTSYLVNHDDINEVSEALADAMNIDDEAAQATTNAFIMNTYFEVADYAKVYGVKDVNDFAYYLADHEHQDKVKSSLAELFRTRNPAVLAEFINSYVSK